MEIIDLTHPIKEGMPKFAAHWHPHVKIEQLGKLNEEGRESRKLVLGTHTGTHVDAPLHFISNGNSIDKIPLEQLNGPVNIIDFSHLSSGEEISKEMIMDLPISERMIFKYGWEDKYVDQNFYRDYPYFSKEAAQFLIDSGVKLLAYDTPSPDNSRTKLGSKEDSEIHKLFLSNNVILVEYLTNLSKIKDFENWNISANPIKIKGGDGAPARVFVYRMV